MLNRNIILIAGKSATGKTMSLRNVKNPEGVIYLCTESNKQTPFKNSFKELSVTDPRQVMQAFKEAETLPDIHTIVIDTLTFLMDQYESQFVLTSKDGRKAWQDYAQYFKALMQQYVANSTKNVIVMAHTVDQLNESEMINETFVKIKGSVMNQGVEAYFNTVISTKKVATKRLKDYQNDLLHITEDEEMLKYKHVFQTRPTEDTVNERIRTPLGMWQKNETYIDNDIQSVIDRLHQYYT